MERSEATALLDRLHAAQNEFYSGNDALTLTALLVPNIAWTVPGDNRIAGSYRGHDEVLAYFRRRRDLAAGTLRMHRKDILVGEGDRLAALTDGTAIIGGEVRQWSTVGLYNVTADRHIAACWLLPLDQEQFDSIWSG